METNDKIYHIIGLTVRARRSVSGEDVCERAIKSGKVKLCIIAQDASDNTKKKFTNMCKYRNVEMVFWGDKDNLGKFTGKNIRTVVAITDDGFARRIKELLNNI